MNKNRKNSLFPLGILLFSLTFGEREKRRKTSAMPLTSRLS